MNLDSSILDTLKIAAPCSASWADMKGDERVRFCPHCQLHVYNISSMVPEEAEALIQKTEGRLCVRFFKRADGTVLTRNCPVGLARANAAKRLASRLAACLGLVFTVSAGTCMGAVAVRREPVQQQKPTSSQPVDAADENTAAPSVPKPVR
jgi:hypothetical protein